MRPWAVPCAAAWYAFSARQTQSRTSPLRLALWTRPPRRAGKALVRLLSRRLTVDLSTRLAVLQCSRTSVDSMADEGDHAGSASPQGDDYASSTSNLLRNDVSAGVKRKRGVATSSARTVANLTPEQLDKKRKNDREVRWTQWCATRKC
jgi:hypothetical protein